MIKTIINDISGYDYVIKDGYGNDYKLNLEFYNLDFSLKKGDIIYFPKVLLINEGIYSFGRIRKPNLSINEYIAVLTNEKKLYFQRYYG